MVAPRATTPQDAHRSKYLDRSKIGRHPRRPLDSHCGWVRPARSPEHHRGILQRWTTPRSGTRARDWAHVLSQREVGAMSAQKWECDVGGSGSDICAKVGIASKNSATLMGCPKTPTFRDLRRPASSSSLRGCLLSR